MWIEMAIAWSVANQRRTMILCRLAESKVLCRLCEIATVDVGGYGATAEDAAKSALMQLTTAHRSAQ